MALLFRTKLNWTGFVGAPGYTVFHHRAFEADPTGESDQLLNALNIFIGGIRDRLPNVVNVAIDPEFEIIEDSTGVLQEVVSKVAPAAQPGTGGTTYSAPTGAIINWRTGQIRNGRRIRGRTFLVPLASSCFDVDGTLLTLARTDLAAAAETLRTAEGPQLCIYGRPTVGAADGVNGEVVSSSVPDMAAVLRSRRD